MKLRRNKVREASPTQEGVLPRVYDTLIRDDIPHMHGASTAQNSNCLPGHMHAAADCKVTHGFSSMYL